MIHRGDPDAWTWDYGSKSRIEADALLRSLCRRGRHVFHRSNVWHGALPRRMSSKVPPTGLHGECESGHYPVKSGRQAVGLLLLAWEPRPRSNYFRGGVGQTGQMETAVAIRTGPESWRLTLGLCGGVDGDMRNRLKMSLSKNRFTVTLDGMCMREWVNSSWLISSRALLRKFVFDEPDSETFFLVIHQLPALASSQASGMRIKLDRAGTG